MRAPQVVDERMVMPYKCKRTGILLNPVRVHVSVTIWERAIEFT